MPAVSMTKPAIVISVTIVLLTLMGFGMLLAAGSDLAHNPRIDPDSITAIIVMGMLTILTMDVFLVRLLSKIINAALSSPKQIQPKRKKQLASPAMVPLPEHSTSRLQGIPSVTENTTRFFEPAYREPAVVDPAAAKKSEL
ncbi:MAG: hypothetical protein ACMG6H_04695 [Acidobacteriota bacterium]